MIYFATCTQSSYFSYYKLLYKYFYRRNNCYALLIYCLQLLFCTEIDIIIKKNVLGTKIPTEKGNNF